MDSRTKRLVKRLTQLGYRPFQIKIIIREAIGVDNLNSADPSQYLQVFKALEKYEQLGSTYMEAYSK
jgi:hypothetical protein